MDVVAGCANMQFKRKKITTRMEW